MTEETDPLADGGRDRTPAENAQLALLLEVSGTPKPGNVDRHRDLGDLRFEHFMAGAVGAADGLRRAEAGDPVGVAFEDAVAGMANQQGGNTQFGCLLLLVPLVRAAASDALTPRGVSEIVKATTVEDAINFYRAFEHVDVAVDDLPSDADALDVRRGSAAAPTLRERGLTLYDIMGFSAEPDDGVPDGNAREWVTGFDRAFGAADRLLADEGPVGDRTARVFLDLLAEEPDTLVAITHGKSTARKVSHRAAEVADEIAASDDLSAAEALAEEFVDAGYNPGTTADLTAAALFIALEGGLSV
ncbi:triphosphoribosyl-dephospho-CoA synthase [Halonotius terrestris]|uniref:Triphosphoribosyl-dephospho-CoA synthase n=1 Tax=Halonotius terrestris TaxID=2487750 RepID=A0A8J8TC90_9EURY|nr:triphosphoribosyl-dephospho-CoA synthase [Halonotius terrestris]TQQ82952.1 triphosphoribosyl-dephospho-CoA synthase [Halonotius terrestris]